ncbi:hypothetical protein CHS0354_011880 [Potamilus streckersoni]|uniref:Uncharacterized protein n=1 Tax=Potamilus streckersoni TaxID=2493646 RepID=A0AAE0T5Z1_9BIVA|nr:hypothetical protein CHS0354_011880 [Potamilus streckersoni]
MLDLQIAADGYDSLRQHLFITKTQFNYIKYVKEDIIHDEAISFAENSFNIEDARTKLRQLSSLTPPVCGFMYRSCTRISHGKVYYVEDSVG